MGPSLVLGLGSGMFIAVAVGIGGVQRKAASCALHDRRAGRAASVLQATCSAVAIALAVGAILAWAGLA